MVFTQFGRDPRRGQNLPSGIKSGVRKRENPAATRFLRSPGGDTKRFCGKGCSAKLGSWLYADLTSKAVPLHTNFAPAYTKKSLPASAPKVIRHNKEKAVHCKANLHHCFQRKRTPRGGRPPKKHVSVLITLRRDPGYCPQDVISCVAA